MGATTENKMRLLTKGESNPKTALSVGMGYYTAILHLAHACSSGYEVCPYRSSGCTHACLNSIGFGRYKKTQKARIARTKLWFESRQQFKAMLIADIQEHIRRCARHNLKPAIRLNGTSDIAWEVEFPEVFSLFPNVQFYDYTKNSQRCMKSYKLPSNYKLIFSRSECNNKEVSRVLRSGKCSVAVVFNANEKTMPQKYKNRNVVYGDSHDLHFLHPSNVVVGLKAKGLRAKYDKSGFVVKPS